MLACSAMVACTNDDVLENNESPLVNKGNSYLSVNLSMGNPVSRAAETQGEEFDNGTDAEAAVKDNNVIFLFYDASGNYVTDGTIQYYSDGNTTPAAGNDLEWNVNDDGTNIERNASPVIVLGPTKVAPAKVIAILNNNALAYTCKEKELSATQDLVRNTTKYRTDAGFVMSNSTYVKDNKVVYAADIAPEQICESAADAIANPVDIYVERVAAKITWKFADTVEGQKEENMFLMHSGTATGDYMVNGNLTQLRVEIVGVKANAYNETSSLVKKINTGSYFTGWNDAGNFRSYWAEDKNYNGVVEANLTEPWEYTGDSFTGLKYLTFVGNENKDQNYGDDAALTFYVNENTMTEPKVAANDKTNATTILVLGRIYVGKDASTANTTLFTYKGGYYTEQNYLNIVASNLTGFASDENGTPLTAADFIWKDTNDKYSYNKVNYQTVVLKPVAIAEGKTIYKKTTTTVEDEVVTTWAEATLADVQNACTLDTKLYLNGMCYYQIPIKHIYNDDTDADALGEYGIVRNHSYQLTLTKLTNIGGAVIDEKEELDHIPGKDKDYYIAATLNVLAWRVVDNQNVEL